MSARDSNQSAYSYIRPQIKTGDIIATTHFGWSSIKDFEVQLVRMVTRSEYAHVGIAWVVAGRVFIIESVNPYVRIFPISQVPEKEFYLIQTQTPMSDIELEFALGQVGKGKYSKWEAIKGLFNAIKVGKNSKWQCAEFVMASRLLSGFTLLCEPTPTAVVNDCLNQGLTLKKVLIE